MGKYQERDAELKAMILDEGSRDIGLWELSQLVAGRKGDATDIWLHLKGKMTKIDWSNAGWFAWLWTAAATKAKPRRTAITISEAQRRHVAFVPQNFTDMGEDDHEAIFGGDNDDCNSGDE
jgi:hypothetical protein